jgi:hypothetical protein
LPTQSAATHSETQLHSCVAEYVVLKWYCDAVRAHGSLIFD